MKKIVIHESGGYEKLKLESHPDLKPEPGEVLVQTKAAGVNYADCLVRWGVYESAKKYIGWPITPGFEFSGQVLECGTNIEKFSVGMPVFGVTRFNAYAEQVVVPEHQLFQKPEELTFEEAAAFPVVYITAYHAVFQLVRIFPGSMVLIHSAAGGVGGALLQLSKKAGFKTIGVVGRAAKLDTAKRYGADFVIDKSSQNLWSEVDRLAPDGLDAIFDANGPETLKQGYHRLAPMGKLISYGSHTMLPRSGESSQGKLNYLKLVKDYLKIPKFHPHRLTTENRTVVGFNISFLFGKPELLQESMENLLKWLQEGDISPPQITSFAFEDVQKAHRHIESGLSTGKIVITLK